MHLYQIPVISPHFGFDFYKISPVWPGALQLPCFLRFQRISTLNQLISTILSSLTDAGSDDSTPAGFNPRTREGATEEGEQEAGKDLGFNPRTREGATGRTTRQS